MAVSPYIVRLRRSIGHDLLLLPSVAVIARDDEGRILLVRQADTGRWGGVGGSVEPDEDPADAAVREAAEEAGVEVELTGVLGVLGGPHFRITYPNGDETAYVSVVYGARVVSGDPTPDGDETLEAAWVPVEDLPGLDLTDYARHAFRALGLLP